MAVWSWVSAERTARMPFATTTSATTTVSERMSFCESRVGQRIV
jgi:hypothetical protein